MSFMLGRFSGVFLMLGYLLHGGGFSCFFELSYVYGNAWVRELLMTVDVLVWG